MLAKDHEGPHEPTSDHDILIAVVDDRLTVAHISPTETG